MTRTRATPDHVARRLWEQAVRTSTLANANASALASELEETAAVRLLGDLEHGLSRWIGSEGYRVLLFDAARLTLPRYPALRSVLTVDGFRAATVSHARVATPAFAEGMVSLLVHFTERLGLIVGEEMALRLVDHAGAPPLGLRLEPHGGAPRRSGIVPIATPEARDDEAI